MAQIGSNTLSVSSSGYGSGSFTYQLIITENSYDASARTANVTVTFQVKGVKSYYSSWKDNDATLSVSTDNGGSGSINLDAQHSTSTSSYTTVGSYTWTFAYKTDGNLTINASATFGWSSSDGNYLPLNSTITASGSCTNIGEATVDPDKVTQAYTYTGSIETFTTPYPGTYTLEVYGAKGSGSYAYDDNNGGTGGKSVGKYLTAAGTNLYICCGGSPTRGTGSNYAGGYNGGGNGSSNPSRYKGGGGGGATHIALESNLLRNCTKSNVLIVAGGGGGSGNSSGYGSGGDGGGAEGGRGSGMRNSSGYYYGGTGGTQTESNASSTMVDTDSNVAGGFGYGGAGERTSSTSHYGGGGGGGGWYGGCGGTTYTSTKSGSGGGGSGYINTVLTDASTTQGGHGYYNRPGEANIIYSHKVLLVNYDGGYSGSTVKANDTYDVAQPYTQTFTPVKVTKTSSSSDILPISLNTNGGNALDDLTTTLTSTSTSTANTFTDGTNSYTAGTSTSINVTDNITLNPTWTTSTTNSYTSVTMPVPTRDNTATIVTFDTTITIDGNGGTWQ